MPLSWSILILEWPCCRRVRCSSHQGERGFVGFAHHCIDEYLEVVYFLESKASRLENGVKKDEKEREESKVM
ncbi:hypothetical protein GGS20DRAFT_557542 [Poronia punctata]|nr:hypothetical protein GGS20DRAFT_557542 [Poronia punctata]